MTKSQRRRKKQVKFKTYNILKWVLFPILLPWCIMQNLVGVGVWIYSKILGYCKRVKTDEGFIYFEVDNNNPCYGVSLGYFVFLQQKYNSDKITHHHEYGHELQSMLLGPLYLILIGLPSGLSNVFNWAKGSDIIYYNYPWEKWADYWGGVKHKNLWYNRKLDN